MRCFFGFHKWSRWELIKSHAADIITNVDGKDKTHSVYGWQINRKCDSCGIIEDQAISNYMEIL